MSGMPGSTGDLYPEVDRNCHLLPLPVDESSRRRSMSDAAIHELGTCAVPPQLQWRRVGSEERATQRPNRPLTMPPTPPTPRRRLAPVWASGKRVQKGAAEMLAREMLRLSVGTAVPQDALILGRPASGRLGRSMESLPLVCENRAPPPAAPPLLVEDPPSSEEVDDDEIRVIVTAASLHGSSSNLSAKSAPPTPLDDRLAPVGGLLGHSPSYAGGLSSGGGNGTSLVPPGSPSIGQASTASSQSPTIPISPSHIFSKHDRQALKQLSTSAPAMTQASVRSGQASSSSSSSASAAAHCASTVTVSAVEGAEPVVPTPGSSKARQKKFHRHFKQVAPEERVLNYYSCALIGDILLQGHLYITKNYFAFYSNVFGYVTKILIPTVSVLKVTKERTAKIIPNAVGVATEEDKHVFGSLLSRDATYKLMVQVWRNARASDVIRKDSIIKPQVVKDEVDSGSNDGNLNDEDDEEEEEEDEEEDEEEEEDSSGSDLPLSPTTAPLPTTLRHIPAKEVAVGLTAEGCTVAKVNGAARLIGPAKTVQSAVKDRGGSSWLSIASRPSVILLISTALLSLLFLSAAFLLYRISLIQNQFIENPLLHGRLSGSDDVYQEILKWQNQLHSKSANEVQEFLNTNLDQIAKVRQSLEALALLIVPDEGELGDQHMAGGSGRLGVRHQRRPDQGWPGRPAAASASSEAQDGPS
ncbi:GRAM domain-containing protein 2B-like isoform X3 [Ischnura elegans]|uniref:GRAM domain-containing protein 2B-like isoform X3 n=1 Tax=Ischnura elegans TaxID=197161 RepID=UPI001ED88EA1|nr:GRAM domain-containing protein 2B-like isoform X3 [Ischnura elegans]